MSKQDAANPEAGQEDLLDHAHREGDLDELARQGLALRLACQQIARRVRYEASQGSIAPHHMAVLARLEDGDQAPGALAELERVSAPSMTRTVNALTELGFVQRTRHPTDGRVVLVGLTAEGRDLLDATRHRRDLWMTSRLGRLEEADLARVPDLVRILTLVAEL